MISWGADAPAIWAEALASAEKQFRLLRSFELGAINPGGVKLSNQLHRSVRQGRPIYRLFTLPSPTHLQSSPHILSVTAASITYDQSLCSETSTRNR
ncbi:hypothetical protein AVEN_103558-1 [Araneus ventricosus]|uniref:Uncharacterized protein n=1 Tax=Araneus ventricosus TaxID=182803 RepID=A0A4Y2G3G0_ARAVE|nr:hypothetical protein AVEN_103558-1 [Araneus ventricosus]